MGTGASVDINVPDNHSGLSKRQKIAVRKIWKQIETNTQKHSIKIFVRFFDKYPGYRKYFVSQSGVEMSKVAEDAHVQSHFRAIVASISSLIKAIISKPKSLDERLNHLAMLHKDMGLGMKDFANFRDVLVSYMKAEFTKEMTIFEITAWNMFLTTMFQRICTRMDEINRQELEDTMDALPAPEQQKKAPLWRRIFKVKNKLGPDYWRQRKVYWRMQKELWSETKSNSEDDLEVLEEGDKDVASQISEAVTSVFNSIQMNLNPDAQAQELAKKSMSSVKLKQKASETLTLYDDIPMPEGGLMLGTSRQLRPNAGNMRPKSPSGTRLTSQLNAGKQPDKSADDGCLPCSSARGRRRNSFNDTYQPSAPPQP